MLRLVFSDSKLPLSPIIKFMTWSEWSHVGILTPDNRVIDSRWSQHGVWVSCFDHFQQQARRWQVREFLHVPEGEIIQAAMSQVGKPYDWEPLFGIPFHRNWQEDDKWFCSELVAWACLQGGHSLVNKETWRITPQDLWQAVL